MKGQGGRAILDKLVNTQLEKLQHPGIYQFNAQNSIHSKKNE